jgi:hypothetical protein
MPDAVFENSNSQGILMAFVKAAAVQLSPVLYSREGTLEKACRQILTLGREGAIRDLPGDGGAVLPLLLLRAAAVQDGR